MRRGGRRAHRAPRVRFGQVHVVNNVHRGRAPLYALAVAAYGGERSRHTGSWFSGRPARLNEIAGGLGLGLTNDVGRDPAEERLRLKTWPELGHVFTDRMQDEVFAWLDAVL